jgi:hypothetical protein
MDRPIVLLDVPKLIKGVVKRGGSADLALYSTRLGPLVAKARNVAQAVEDELARPRRYSSLREDIAEDVFYRPGSAAPRVAAVVRFAAGTLAELPEDVLHVSPDQDIPAMGRMAAVGG